MHNKRTARTEAGQKASCTRIVDHARARINRAIVWLVYWRILPPQWAYSKAARLRCKGV